MSRYSPRRVRGLLKSKPKVFRIVVWWLGPMPRRKRPGASCATAAACCAMTMGVAGHVGDDGGAQEDAAGLRARGGKGGHGVGAARAADGHPDGGDAGVLRLPDARDGGGRGGFLDDEADHGAGSFLPFDRLRANGPPHPNLPPRAGEGTWPGVIPSPHARGRDCAAPRPRGYRPLPRVRSCFDFPQHERTLPPLWIPAFAGMTVGGRGGRDCGLGYCAFTKGMLWWARTSLIIWRTRSR